MGAVFEAVHAAIERRVAIKVLLPELARNEQATARLFNEARAVNRIEHASIAQVSDCGQLPDGTAYIVMEFVRGQTLTQWHGANPGPVSPQMVVRLAAQMTGALAAAHEKGIVHRDIKPDNIMLVEDAVDPSGYRVKLLDFGIAKLAEGPSKSKTATGLLMGTPYYMSPEQCQGAGYVDDKSDVYSLGVVLFELLAGKRPFDAEGGGQLIGMHLFKPPPLLRELAPSVPSRLAELVQGLLAKERDERPKMAELRAEFEAMARGNTLEPSSSFSARRGTTDAQLAALPSQRSGPATLAESGAQPIAPVSVSASEPPPRRGKGLLAVAVLLLGAASLLIFLRRTPPADSQPPRPAPISAPVPVRQSDAPSVQPAPGPVDSGPNLPPPALTHWSIVTHPAGAAVVRPADGYVLGTTPWDSDRPPAHGSVRLTLRKAGYFDETVTLESDVNMKLNLNLRPRPGVRRPRVAKVQAVPRRAQAARSVGR